MRKLSLNILFLFLVISAAGQVSPHGESLLMDCADCHSTQGWHYVATARFNHDSTNYILEGQHKFAECAACHKSLVFSEAKSNCVDCHEDLHNTTLGSDCASCHTQDSWIVTNITELHQQSRFPLLGAHTTADCASCHKSASLLEFEPLGVECMDCHMNDYLATTRPNHVQTDLSTDCAECHEVSALEWSASGDSHSFFPLTQGHNIDCSECHTNDLTEPLSPECFSCHEEMFKQAENHVSLGYPTDCEICHTLAGWEQSIFDHNTTTFALTGAHESAECLACHSEGYTGIPSDCNSCHTDKYNQATNPNHTAAGISSECETCHGTTNWSPSTFNHLSSTGFELTGGHALQQCSDCHVGTTSGASSDCISCHQENYNAAKDHITLGYPDDCTFCHNTTNWWQSTFDHNATAFPLTGSHRATECASCHASGYTGTPTECSACHSNNYNNAQNPNHTAAGVSTECEDCHGTTAWTPSTFDHNTTTGFALTGGHALQQCSDCHVGSTSGASSDCISCHQTDYNTAKDHVAQNYPTECILCHTTTNWDKSTFDHNATSFPLTGSHIATECIECHTSGYAGTPSECSACHTDEYTAATDPDHKTAGVSTDCETCHGTTAWIPSTFDHNSTGFALTGGHLGRQCSDCHIGSTSGASSACISCHRTEYNNAAEHVSQNYSEQCLMCHNTSSWSQVSFDHNSTSFPLTGAHRTTDCDDCHTSGYAGTPTACRSCHINEYNNADDPNHVTPGISKVCESCHGTSSWTSSTFDHNASSGFPLTGGHALNQCSACHIGSTSGASSECYSCHSSNYSNANNPSHTAAGISTNCEPCHGTSNWIPSTFDHTASTGFPLSGGHNLQQCSDCHIGTTSGASSDCITCHQTDYNQASNHVAQNFPFDCLICHNTTNWSQSTFDHNATSFPLNGAHRATECIACHSTGYTGTPTECYDCHKADYDGVTNPNHKAGNFSTDCTDCHNENAWTPSTFDHDNLYFPIYSGIHNGEWSNCSDCHKDASNYASFTCFDCHRQLVTGVLHLGVTDYNYDNASCLACHPNGAVQ